MTVCNSTTHKRACAQHQQNPFMEWNEALGNVSQPACLILKAEATAEGLWYVVQQKAQTVGSVQTGQHSGSSCQLIHLCIQRLGPENKICKPHGSSGCTQPIAGQRMESDPTSTTQVRDRQHLLKGVLESKKDVSEAVGICT